MEKKGVLTTLVALFISLFILRAFGPTQPWFEWTVTTTRWANALLFISLCFIIYHLFSTIQDDRIRSIIQNIFIVISTIMLFFVYQNQLTTVFIGLGILAAAGTLIFQAPLLSIVAWIYLTTTNVYRKGDRIRVGDVKGEVLSINPMRTEILEIGGEYVANDLTSGRVNTFPNSLILSQTVSNYTTEYPYLWVDIPFQLTYETDFDFVKKTMEQIARKHIKTYLADMEQQYKRFMRQHKTKGEFKPIAFNINPIQSWIEIRITIPLPPKKQTDLTTAITEDLLKAFNKNPNKVRFPKGRNR